MNAYSDMLALPRPVSARHPQMRRADRAKQFMPFAALRGYEETIEEKQVLYERRREMGDDIEGACGQLRRSVLKQEESIHQQ